MSKPVILFVDDEKTVLVSLKSQVKRAFQDRFMYETAENGQEALELIDDLASDGISILVIISDWLMPGMKGDEFLIRVHEKYPDIHKIMLTGQADEEAIERAKSDANLNRVIYKPWIEGDVVEIIHNVIKELE